MERMTGLDAAFLYAETPAMHLHTLGVVVMEGTGARGPVRLAEIKDVIGSRIPLTPPLRRRAVEIPGGIDHPLWIEDPDFDLDNHLRSLTVPDPGDAAALAEFVGEVASHPLDRHKPLWEMWVVDGLEDGSVALVDKFHHAIMDGAGAGDLLAQLFDLEPEPRSSTEPTKDWVPDVVPSRASLVRRSVRSLAARQTEAPRAVAETVGNLTGTLKTWVSQRVAGTGVPLTAPRTVFNGAVSPRRAVCLRRVPFAKVLETKRAFETTVNDVVLAASASAIRGYLMARTGVPDRPIIASVPVADKNRVDKSGFGNHVSAMMVPLPLGDLDPVDRLMALHHSARSSKELSVSIGPDILSKFTGFVSPNLISGFARIYSALHLADLHPPVSNLVVSNIVGPRIDLYCAGTRITAAYPLGPVMEGMGLNITVLSMADDLDIGIIACALLVDDVGEVGDRFVDAIDELQACARARARSEHEPEGEPPAGQHGSRPAPRASSA